jgi:hypothetical protein
MSSTKALVRLSDNLLFGEPTPVPVNPNSDLYMVVDTPLADINNHLTRNYRWNVKESKFYDAGLKDVSGKDPTKVILTPFTITDNYFYRGQGFDFSAAAGGVTEFDLLIPEERAIDGSELWISSTTFGCKADFLVVDKDGIMAPAGTVLDQFAYGWNIYPNSENAKRPGYPARIYSGLYIRVRFDNPSASAIHVYGNLRLHEHKEGV